MTLDTVVSRAYPTTTRVDKFCATARKFLQHWNPPPAQLWQVLLGHISSLEKLVPRGRLRMRSLQWHLKSHWTPERDPSNLPVPRSRQVEEDLSWWMVRDHLLEGASFGSPAPDLRLYSDASRAGWGAHLLDQSASGVWSYQETSLHVNLLEMKALFLALQSFRNLVTGHRVTAMCDNSTVVAYVNKQGVTVSSVLCSLTGQLLRWTETRDIQLEARYPPGQANVLVDLLSRRNQVLGAEWSLHPQVARDLLHRWGSPTLVLFATHLNAKLLLYCSLIPNPQAALEDAFRHPWNNLDTYAFPPFHLVRRVVARVRDPRSLDDPRCAPLAREGLVRGPTPSPNPTSTNTAAVGSTATPTPLPHVPRRRPRSEPSCVVSLQRLLRKSGFSRDGVREVSDCVRESTVRLYQSQWLSCNWCRRRGTPPIDATVPLIVDFLIHLRRDKGFSLSALKGYRAAINSVLALKGTDLSDSRELAMLFRSFTKSCPTTDLLPPAWPVALVLNSLTAAPYEPIKEAEERFLAQKMLFLLALASAKRVGELHALSHRVSHSVGWKEVSFSFVPGFVAKTQDQSSLDPRFESFTIPALPRSRDSPNGRLLCPVRAVRQCLSRTASHRPCCERLFVTSGRTKKEISKNTVSF